MMQKVEGIESSTYKVAKAAGHIASGLNSEADDKKGGLFHATSLSRMAARAHTSVTPHMMPTTLGTPHFDRNGRPVFHRTELAGCWVGLSAPCVITTAVCCDIGLPIQAWFVAPVDGSCRNGCLGYKGRLRRVELVFWRRFKSQAECVADGEEQSSLGRITNEKSKICSTTARGEWEGKQRNEQTWSRWDRCDNKMIERRFRGWGSGRSA
jgi:hypothetical protein